MSLVRQMRGGKDYEFDFATRKRGTGAFAVPWEQRFTRACERLGLDRGAHQPLDTSRFRPPRTGPRFDPF